MLKGCTPKHREIHGTCKYIPLRCRGVRKALGQITCFVIASHISKYIAIPGCRSRGVGRRCSWCSMHQVRQCKPLGHVIIRPLQTNKKQACLLLVLEDSDTGVKIVPVHHPQTVPLLWAVRLPLAGEVCGMHTRPLWDAHHASEATCPKRQRAYPLSLRARGFRGMCMWEYHACARCTDLLQQVMQTLVPFLCKMARHLQW